MKKTLLIIFASVLWSFFGFAQSQPIPFDLSTGNFLFSEWDSTSAPGTYPSSMILHTLNAQTASIADTGKADWTCAYNLNAGPRFKGKGLNGIGMVNTGSSQLSTCASDTATPVYVGELVVGMNTTGRNNIQVSWIGRMISSFNYVPSPGSNPVNRFFALVCQYRIGTTGPFMTFSNDSIFYCNLNDTTYHPQGYADTLGYAALPVSCEDQPVVQLRWLYFQTNSGQGPRPELAVDDISITSDLSTTINAGSNPSSLTIFPNPAEKGQFNLSSPKNFRVFNAQGMEVLGTQTNHYVNLVDFPAGIYFMQCSDGKTHKLIKK
jgi:hypothetical protein